MIFTIIVASLVSLFVYALVNVAKGYLTRSTRLKDAFKYLGISNFGTTPGSSSIPHVFSQTESSKDVVASLTKSFAKKEEEPSDFEKSLKAYQEKNNSKVIFINHRDVKGPMGISMFDSKATLSLKDAAAVMDILKEVEEGTTLDLIMNTTGGSLTASEIIINAFRNSGCKVRVFIPYYAMSAGTLIAITVADEIFLGKNAFVGPVDPQLALGFSAVSIINFSQKLQGNAPFENSSGGPVSWFGDMVRLGQRSAQAALDRVHNLIKNVYTTREYEITCAPKVIEELVGKYNHDQPIFFKTLQKIAPMQVFDGLPKEVDELFEFHNNDGKKPSNSPFGMF